ncbi:MAG: hypothetical protein Kow0099_10130 [Candidatus Abyssubacteria bacterium]
MNDMHDCRRNLEKRVIKKEFSRRDFIRAAAVGTAGAAFASGLAGCGSGSQTPRVGLGNMFTENGKPLLAAVEGADLGAMLDAGIAAMGGLEKLVKGKTVVLKPNIVASQPYPVTTDIEMVLAVSERLRGAGAQSITVCDAAGGGVARAEKFNALNYPSRLEEAGILLDATDFSDRLSHVFVSKDAWRSHPTIGVVKTIYRADVVISLPVVKRHGSARFTCALKNHFGSVFFPLRQVAHNKQRSAADGTEFFDTALAEFADAVRPELNIVDARTLLVRGGPTLSGAAEVKPGVNRLVLCGDMLATDIYCSQLMQEYDETFSPDMISIQLEAADKLGLGARNLNNVVIKEIVA